MSLIDQFPNFLIGRPFAIRYSAARSRSIGVDPGSCGFLQQHIKLHAVLNAVPEDRLLVQKGLIPTHQRPLNPTLVQVAHLPIINYYHDYHPINKSYPYIQIKLLSNLSNLLVLDLGFNPALALTMDEETRSSPVPVGTDGG